MGYWYRIFNYEILINSEHGVMTKKVWTITEVIETFQVDETFLAELEKEEIVCPTCGEGQETKLFSSIEVEKLRIARILTADLDVNLPGVEIILRMREETIKMRRQFDDILRDLSQHLKANLRPRL